jgi:TPR repeat protein
MREIVPDQRRPFYVRYWIIIPSCLILAGAVIIYAWSDATEASPKLSYTPFLNQKSSAEVDSLSMSDLLAAAESGNALAQLRLANGYREGLFGFTKDDKKSFEWILKAAKAGIPDAKIKAGECYFRGIGTEQDFENAHEMFHAPATELNDPTAQLYMGLLYGGGRGFPCRDDVAVEWFKKSAAGGNALGAANYGRALFDGRGVAKDANLAVGYLKASVDGGAVASLVYLGWAYQVGEGVEKDLKEAARLYRLAADKGDAAGYHYLAMLYLNGVGVIKDIDLALKWMKASCVAGDVGAMKRLGNLYHTGEELPKDAYLASKYFFDAARSGDVECQFVMGVRYQYGIGCPISPTEAYAWFNIASANGETKAAESREALAKTLNHGQIAAAQKRSRDILVEMEGEKRE